MHLLWKLYSILKGDKTIARRIHTRHHSAAVHSQHISNIHYTIILYTRYTTRTQCFYTYLCPCSDSGALIDHLLFFSRTIYPQYTLASYQPTNIARVCIIISVRLRKVNALIKRPYISASEGKTVWLWNVVYAIFIILWDGSVSTYNPFTLCYRF